MLTQTEIRPTRTLSSDAVVPTEYLARTIGAVALAGVAIIHLVDLPDTLQETPLIGDSYYVLISAAVLGAVVLISVSRRLVWAFAALIAGAAIIAYVLSRTTGLPADRVDLGNWNCALGIAALSTEALIVLLAMWRIQPHRRLSHAVADHRQTFARDGDQPPPPGPNTGAAAGLGPGPRRTATPVFIHRLPPHEVNRLRVDDGPDGGRGLGVLLIHGQPGSSVVWTRVEPLLRARGFDVLTDDRPGRPVVIVSHGFGAGPAIALAATAPHHVRALVLVAPTLSARAIPFCDRLMAAPIFGPAVAWLGFRIAGLALHQPGLRRHLLQQRAGLTAARAEQVVHAFTRGSTWRRFTIERRQIIHDGHRLNRRLAQLRCPTIVVAGRGDHTAPFPLVSALAARVPGAQLVSTDTGHLVPIDDPDAVLDAVLRAYDLPQPPAAPQSTQRGK